MKYQMMSGMTSGGAATRHLGGWGAGFHSGRGGQRRNSGGRFL